MNTYVINRSDRPERLAHIIAQLKEQGLNAHRFEAVIAKPGWVGCRMSHIKLLEKCKNDVYVIILEDDVKFINPFTLLEDAIREAPLECDAIYLGASPKEPQVKYSSHLYRLKNAHTTHAILWHPRQGGAVEYILEHQNEIRKIDDYFATVIQPMFNVFCIAPMICTQAPGFHSDTCTRSDTTTIEKNFNLYCK